MTRLRGYLVASAGLGARAKVATALAERTDDVGEMTGAEDDQDERRITLIG